MVKPRPAGRDANAESGKQVIAAWPTRSPARKRTSGDWRNWIGEAMERGYTPTAGNRQRSGRATNEGRVFATVNGTATIRGAGCHDGAVTPQPARLPRAIRRSARVPWQGRRSSRRRLDAPRPSRRRSSAGTTARCFLGRHALVLHDSLRRVGAADSVPRWRGRPAGRGVAQFMHHVVEQTAVPARQVEAARLDLAQVVEDQDLQRLLVAGELHGLRQEEVVGKRGNGRPEDGRRRLTHTHKYTMGLKIADFSESWTALKRRLEGRATGR